VIREKKNEKNKTCLIIIVKGTKRKSKFSHLTVIIPLLFHSHHMMLFLWIAVIIVVFLLFKFLNSTDIPKIHGLPEPSGWPIFGNLFELGDNHAKALSQMAKKFGPVFQVRMGNRRIIVANSYDSIKELWLRNQSALISRPALHTFHNIVSSQGLSIGTSPWDESCKQRRKAAATALNKPAVQSYMPIIDFESYSALNEILKEC